MKQLISLQRIVKNKHLASHFEKLLLFLILLFLPTQLGKHFWPSFSFVSGIRSDYLSPTLHVTDVLIGLLFVQLFFNRSAKQSIQKLLKKYFTELVVVFTILLSGISFAKEPLLGVYGFIKLLEFVFLGWYITQFRKKTLWILVGFAFALGMVFEGVLALLQFQSQSSIGGVLYYFGERTFSSTTPGIANASINGHLILRPYATLSHPNVLAGYGLLGILILALCLSFVKNNLARVVFTIAIIVGAGIVIVSLSRIAILLLCVVAGAMVLFGYRQNKGRVVVSLIIVLTVGVLFVSPLLYGRFTLISLQDETIVSRIEGTKTSVMVFAKRPFFGVGLNNYLHNITPEQRSATPLFTSLQPVHNIYVLAAVETGIMGFAVGVYVLTRLGIFLIKSKTKNKHILILMMFVVFAIGLFDHYFWTLQQGRMLGAVIFALVLRSLRSV